MSYEHLDFEREAREWDSAVENDMWEDIWHDTEREGIRDSGVNKDSVVSPV